MGMQITSLSGAGTAVQYGLSGDKRLRPFLPGERNAESVQSETTQSGNIEPQLLNLGAAVSELEQISQAFDRRLKFVIDQESSRVRVKVIDNETDKVIRELPPEELQRLHGRIRETIGFLYDRTV